MLKREKKDRLDDPRGKKREAVQRASVRSRGPDGRSSSTDRRAKADEVVLAFEKRKTLLHTVRTVVTCAWLWFGYWWSSHFLSRRHEYHGWSRKKALRRDRSWGCGAIASNAVSCRFLAGKTLCSSQLRSQKCTTLKHSNIFFALRKKVILCRW